MSSNTMVYKDYYGSIEVSEEDDCLHGKILFINDLVIYEADTIPQLRKEFISAVDDYIATCAEIHKEPQKPFKGSFNVRISQDLHKRAAISAQLEKISLNELAFKAISNYVNKTDLRPINIEHHDHHHYHEEIKQIGSYGETGDSTWKISPPAQPISH